MKNGVPFDVAFGMDDVMRQAAHIMFAEFEGAKFNIDAMAFEKEG